MNVMIVGGGLLGRHAAELLDQLGHDVVLLDENAENLALLDPDFQGVTSLGFPMDLNCLREAGIESCDAVVVATADDNLNITVGQMARDVFGIHKVVSRISDPERESVFQGLGLLSVCPTNMAADKLVSVLTSPWQGRQVSFGAATVALEARPLEKKWAGRTTAQLEARPGDGLLGIVRADGRFLLRELGREVPLEEGDMAVYSRVID